MNLQSEGRGRDDSSLAASWQLLDSDNNAFSECIEPSRAVWRLLLYLRVVLNSNFEKPFERCFQDFSELSSNLKKPFKIIKKFSRILTWFEFKCKKTVISQHSKVFLYRNSNFQKPLHVTKSIFSLKLNSKINFSSQNVLPDWDNKLSAPQHLLTLFQIKTHDLCNVVSNLLFASFSQNFLLHFSKFMFCPFAEHLVS